MNTMTKFNFDRLPELPDSESVPLYALRASDNAQHWHAFKMLVRDGVALHGSLKTENNLPSYHLVLYSHRSTSPFIWLTPRAERFLLTYLLTGKTTGLPSELPDGHLPDFIEENYILKHLRREVLYNVAYFTPTEQDGEQGVCVKAYYPYGSIDYGFFPGSTDALLARLEKVEAYSSVASWRDIPDINSSALPVIYKELSKGQYLEHIFSDKRVPTNCILNKTICGAGATHLEILSERHSIIIEPNVPVIAGKCQQHKSLIGVFGSKSSKEIAKSVQSRIEDKQWVKLMTTPDSYPKVVDALKGLKQPYKKEYFLLIDECEKLVSEIDFRQNMALPIDDFFDFTYKAMVSATPIVINDPRFEEQGFQVIKIRPTFDYRQPLELKPTNNVHKQVERTLQELGQDLPVCLFYNSLEGIKELIEDLKIVDHTNIYCSTDAAKELKKAKYKVFDTVTDENGTPNLNRYNFFTSRFYSAVDIKLSIKPRVVLISDVFKVKNNLPFTLIDPQTEAIQIAGRFRNGVERLIHITNTNWKLKYRTKEELEQFLKEEHLGYQELVALQKQATSTGAQHFFTQAIDRTDYVCQGFVTPRGTLNYFRHNNAYLDERLKMLYQTPAALNKAYHNSDAFDVYAQSEYLIYTDQERQQLADKNTSKAERVRILYGIYQRKTHKDRLIYETLKKEHPLYFEAFATIGYAKVKELSLKDAAIRAEIDRVKSADQAIQPEVIAAVYQHFQPNTIYSTAEVNQQLQTIYDAYGIKYDKRGIGENITRYFEASATRTGNQRKWNLKGKKY